MFLIFFYGRQLVSKASIHADTLNLRLTATISVFFLIIRMKIIKLKRMQGIDSKMHDFAKYNILMFCSKGFFTNFMLHYLVLFVITSVKCVNVTSCCVH